MAAERETSWAGISGLITTLLLAAGAVWVRYEPLETTRPPPPLERYAMPTERLHDVDARLWQDPFAAVEKHHQGQEAKAKGVAQPAAAASKETPKVNPNLIPASGSQSGKDNKFKHLKSDLQRRAQQGVTVLGVMTVAGPYVGATERRLRNRYAVVSALNEAGYVPVDEEHIGYFDTPPGLNLPTPFKVPFEWFEHEVGLGNQTNTLKKPSVLVLWLNDEALSQEWEVKSLSSSTDSQLTDLSKDKQAVTSSPAAPLRAVSNLYQQLSGSESTPESPIKQVSNVASGSSPDIGNIHFKLIGPESSTTLQKMLKELSEPNQQASKAYLKIELYSPFATASDEWLSQPSDRSKHTLNIEIFRKELGDFLRITVPDDELATAVAKELKLRNMKVNDPVVLISQRDTFYSRGLKGAFEKALKQEGFYINKSFGYWRGLDGVLPGDGAKSEDNRKESTKSENVVETVNGNRQVDYLRRLAAELKQTERELQRAGDPDGIRAIGVLGNDYHDKLLILRALKPLFPSALFFTTDLDAQMLHPIDNAWTRNLIVASGFGLTLNSKLQRDTPPFRDNLQTATYLAVYLALADQKSECASLRCKLGVRDEQLIHVAAENQNQEILAPRIFEIGRTRAIDLSTSNNDDLLYSKPASVFWGLQTLSSFLLALLFIGALLFCTCRDTNREHALLTNQRSWFGLAILLTIAAGIWYIVKLEASPHGGEPFSWMEGVSMWPTEILRALTLALTIAMLLYGWHKIKNNEKELTCRFFPGENPETKDVNYSKLSPNIAPPDIDCTQKEVQTHEAYDAWKKHCQPGGFICFMRQRWWIPLQVVLLFLTTLFLMQAFGFPDKPARGQVVLWVDKTMTFILIPAFLLLLFFVVDVTRRTCDLAVALREQTHWPDESMKRFGLRLLEEGKDVDWGRMKNVLSDWLDIHLLAERTIAVNSLIYYPFIVLALLYLSRSPLFDNWSLPLTLVMVYLISLAYALYCAFILRRDAEETRSESRKRFTAALVELKGRRPNKNAEQSLITQMEFLLREIEGLRTGAFSPFSQQPALKALLAVLSGISGITILEYFAFANL